MKYATSRIDLMTFAGRRLDSFEFKIPLPFGEVYADEICLINKADSGDVGRAVVLNPGGVVVARDDRGIGPGETLVLNDFCIVVSD